MTRFLRCAAALALSIPLLACSRSLTHDQVRVVIMQSSLVRAMDNLSVDAVSPSGATEAIVRATIAGETNELEVPAVRQRLGVGVR
jgi:hypothetical protein